MSNKKNILILAVGVLITFSSLAQTAPGYLGKRLTVSYSGAGIPAIFNPNKNGEKGITSWNYSHNINADYVLNRKKSIGFGFEMYTTGIDYSSVSFEAPFNDPFGYNTTATYTAQQKSKTLPNGDYLGVGILNVKGISVYRLKYKNGIAPLGKYSIFGAKLLYATTDLSHVNFTNFNDPLPFITTTKTIKNIDFGIVWGMGVSRIIADKVVFKIGMESTILPSALFSYFGDVEAYGNESEAAQVDMFKEFAKKRLFASQFLNIKFSIGFLAH